MQTQNPFNQIPILKQQLKHNFYPTLLQINRIIVPISSSLHDILHLLEYSDFSLSLLSASIIYFSNGNKGKSIELLLAYYKLNTNVPKPLTYLSFYHESFDEFYFKFYYNELLKHILDLNYLNEGFSFFIAEHDCSDPLLIPYMVSTKNTNVIKSVLGQVDFSLLVRIAECEGTVLHIMEIIRNAEFDFLERELFLRNLRVYVDALYIYQEKDLVLSLFAYLFLICKSLCYEIAFYIEECYLRWINKTDFFLIEEMVNCNKEWIQEGEEEEVLINEKILRQILKNVEKKRRANKVYSNKESGTRDNSSKTTANESNDFTTDIDYNFVYKKDVKTEKKEKIPAPPGFIQHLSINNLILILNGEFKRRIFSEFYAKYNLTSFEFLTQLIKPIVKNSQHQQIAVLSQAFMNLGSTNDSFYKTNTDLVLTSKHWIRFVIQAASGIIHSGHYNSFSVLNGVLPVDGTGNDGGGLFALGLVDYNKLSNEISVEYLVNFIDDYNSRLPEKNDLQTFVGMTKFGQVYGAYLGVGLLSFGSYDYNLVKKTIDVKTRSNVLTCEAGCIGLGLILAGIDEEYVDFDKIGIDYIVQSTFKDGVLYGEASFKNEHTFNSYMNRKVIKYNIEGEEIKQKPRKISYIQPDNTKASENFEEYQRKTEEIIKKSRREHEKQMVKRESSSTAKGYKKRVVYNEDESTDEFTRKLDEAKISTFSETFVADRERYGDVFYESNSDLFVKKEKPVYNDSDYKSDFPKQELPIYSYIHGLKRTLSICLEKVETDRYKRSFGMAFVLMAIGSKKILPDTRNMLNSTDSVLRYCGVLTLGSALVGTSNLGVISELLSFVNDQSDDVKRGAIFSLGFVCCLDGDKLKDFLVPFLTNHNKFVRHAAAVTLGFFLSGTGDLELAEQMEHLLYDEDTLVKQGGCLGLGLLLMQYNEKLEFYLKLQKEKNEGGKEKVGKEKSNKSDEKEDKTVNEKESSKKSDKTNNKKNNNDNKKKTFVDDYEVISDNLLYNSKYKELVDRICFLVYDADDSANITGPVIGRSLLEAGGRNIIFSVCNMFGKVDKRRVAGALLFFQYWYHYINFSFLTICAKPTLHITIDSSDLSNTENDLFLRNGYRDLHYSDILKMPVVKMKRRKRLRRRYTKEMEMVKVETKEMQSWLEVKGLMKRREGYEVKSGERITLVECKMNDLDLPGVTFR